MKENNSDNSSKDYEWRTSEIIPNPFEVQDEQRILLSEKSISDEPDSSSPHPKDGYFDYSEDCADYTRLSKTSRDMTKLPEAFKAEKECPDQPVFRTRWGRVLKPAKDEICNVICDFSCLLCKV